MRDNKKMRRRTQRRVDISNALARAMEVWCERDRYTAETTLAREIERELDRFGWRITRKPKPRVC